MKELFKNIIERLEENQIIEMNLNGEPPKQTVDFVKVIEIVNQVAEEYGDGWILPCHCKDFVHVDYQGCAGTTIYCRKNGCFMQEDDFCKYAEPYQTKETEV